jgi:hypothetical protein
MASDLKGWDVFKDPKWLLDNLLKKYRIIRVPTNANWFSSVTGSGAVGQYPLLLLVRTGTTASSSALLSANALGLNSSTLSKYYVDWTKRLEIYFTIVRLGSDPECVARFQLKESGALGPLAQRGVGIEIANLALRGEGYGTSRGTVDLTTITQDKPYEIKIVKYSSILEFWVNNVLLGQLSGNYVPNELGAASASLVASVNNGPTGGVDDNFLVSNILIIQER